MSETVRYFSGNAAPRQPYTNERIAGWYWRDERGAWAGPAPGGKAEAEHHATRAGAVR